MQASLHAVVRRSQYPTVLPDAEEALQSGVPAAVADDWDKMVACNNLVLTDDEQDFEEETTAVSWASVRTRARPQCTTIVDHRRNPRWSPGDGRTARPDQRPRPHRRCQTPPRLEPGSPPPLVRPGITRDSNDYRSGPCYLHPGPQIPEPVVYASAPPAATSSAVQVNPIEWTNPMKVGAVRPVRGERRRARRTRWSR